MKTADGRIRGVKDLEYDVRTNQDAACIHSVFDIDSGTLLTMVEDDVSIPGFERISVLIDPGVSSSVVPTRERKDTPLEEPTR